MPETDATLSDATRREHVMATLGRLAAKAEARGDLKSALRAIVYLARISGAFKTVRAVTSKAQPVAEVAPVKLFKSKQKYQGIVLDPPVRSGQLVAA